MSAAILPQPPVATQEDKSWPLILVCWIVLVLAWSLPNLATLALHTGATDNTMRLLQVRNFLDGAGWFGLHEARLDPPRGLDSHWSRLVDVPIAGLVLLGGLFLDARNAEFFAMVAWPALTYLAMMVGFVAIALRLAPHAGPLPAIAAFIACLPVSSYFKPLAIDHHNVQMALAIALMAAAVWAGTKPRVAVFGGLAACLVVAIGFESLHVLFAVEGLVVLMAVFGGPQDRRAAIIWFLAQAVAIIPVYLVNTPPDWWWRTACDALQLNMTVVLLVGSLGAAAGLFVSTHWARAFQLTLLGAVGAGTLAIGYMLDPSCIAGPNAAVLPEAITLWMSKVQEAEPWLSLLSTNRSQAAVFMAYPALALCAALLLLWRRQFDTPMAILFCVTMVAAAVMFGQVRASTYSAIFGAVFLSVALCRLVPDGSLARVYRILGSAVIPILAILSAASLFKEPAEAQNMSSVSSQQAAEQKPAKAKVPVDQRCSARDGFLPLANQPIGLVLAHIDMGPATLLNTRHTVMMAPYHRADDGIVLGTTLMELPLRDAKAALQKAGVIYLADCDGFAGALGTPEAPLLRNAMLGNVAADWLEPIPSTKRFPDMKFWRVKP
jgi:hypothetical protein